MNHEMHGFTLPTHPTICPLTWNGATTYVDAHRAKMGKKAVVVAGTGHREKDFPRLDLTIFSLDMAAEEMQEHLSSKGAQYDPMWLWNTKIWAQMEDAVGEELLAFEVTLVESGVALGWDLILAAGAFKVGIPYIAYVPFESQASAWPKAQQALWTRYIANAAAVVLVTPDSEIDTIGGKLTKDGVIQALYKRNYALVHGLTGERDFVFSFDKGKASGGTRHCVKVAESLGRKIVNFWDKFETWVALPAVTTLQLPNLGKMPKYEADGEFYKVEMVPVPNNMGEGFAAEMARITAFRKGTVPSVPVIIPPTALATAVANLGF